jgi:hypothetical protein
MLLFHIYTKLASMTFRIMLRAYGEACPKDIYDPGQGFSF